ncbi:helix-turn-helix transcriptional regulator [Thiobacillus sp.]
MMEQIMYKADRSLVAARPNDDSDTNEPHDMQLPRLVATNTLPFRRTIRRTELRQIVPLADTTIYDMERRGEFPRRFNLTARCVVWDLTEVEAWLDARRQASDSAQLKRAPSPDVRQRKHRPVKAKPLS